MAKEEIVNPFSNHPKSAYWSENNEITSDQVEMNSSKCFLFDCPDCKHEFKKSPNDISSKNKWCPFCINRARCDDDNCNFCFNNSFASHEMAKLWSKQNKISPRNIGKYTQIKYYFDCDKCGHTFLAEPAKIVCYNVGCSYCANTKLCSDENCKICFEKSFASSSKAKLWIKEKNDCLPRDIFYGTVKKYFLKCDVCNHEIHMVPNSIKQGRNCVYCGSMKLCENDDCTYCFDKSLASILKIEQFIFKKGDEHCTFKCKTCEYIYTNTANHISNGQGCPNCKNKTEKMLYGILIKEYPNIKKNQKYDWCKSDKDRLCLFDFVIEKLKAIIELDGDQHFNSHKMFKVTPKEQRKRDVHKMKCANEHDYSVIRLLQIDVYNNRNNWKELLDDAINRIQEGTVINQYIAGSDIYERHIKDLELSHETIYENIRITCEKNEKARGVKKVETVKKDEKDEQVNEDEEDEQDEEVRNEKYIKKDERALKVKKIEKVKKHEQVNDEQYEQIGIVNKDKQVKDEQVKNEKQVVKIRKVVKVKKDEEVKDEEQIKKVKIQKAYI